MSKSTNVSVSMSPSCARAWRRLERSFEGDGAMLPVMVRGLADAWASSTVHGGARNCCAPCSGSPSAGPGES